jgi:predicted ribosomally synthesized peptide with SipW-like signal peptide
MKGRKRIKQYLMLLLVAGVIAVIASGGGGTFASFNATTSNPNNVFSTGQILLHNTANGGTVCTSESGSQNSQSCDTLFSNLTIRPGQTQHAYLTLTNAGSLADNGIQFWRGACGEGTPTVATLNGPILSGAATSGSIAVNGDLTQALVEGTPIKVSDGTHTMIFHVAAAGAAANASTIPVTESSWSTAMNTNAKVTIDTDQFTSSPGLCSGLHFNIVEMSAANGSGSNVGCAWGSPSGATCDFTNNTFVLDHPSSSSSAPESLVLATGQGGNSAQTLSPGKSRYFDLVVTADSGLGNSAQNDAVSFDLNWQITAS